MKSELEEMAILPLSEVKRLTRLCKSTIYDWMAQGKFPKNVKLSSKKVGWRARDILSWLESLTV